MDFCLLVLVVLCIYGSWRLYKRWPRGPLAFDSLRQSFGGLTVADVAFNYERAILDLDNVSEATKERAMRSLSGLIVPLVGHVRLDDVTSQLEYGVDVVLRAQLGQNEAWVIHLWHDLLRWGRCHLAPPEQRDRQYGKPW